MFCPACNNQNDAMATHCYQCRTQLIVPSQDRAPEVKAVVRSMNSRMYGGIGFGIFFGIGLLIFERPGISVLLGFAGNLIGRYIANRNG